MFNLKVYSKITQSTVDIVYAPHPQIVDVVASAYWVSQNFFLNKKYPKNVKYQIKQIKECHYTDHLYVLYV